MIDQFPLRPADDPNNVDFWGLYERSWEWGLDDALAAHLGSDKAFVDVGAWIGPVSLIAAGLCRHVYAVEPDPVAAEQWRLNVRLSGVNNASLIEAAVGTGSAALTVGVKPGGAWGDSMTSALFTDQVHEVPALTLPDWFTASRITDVGLTKIDIEGYEAELLAHSGAFLASLDAPLLVSTHRAYRTDPVVYDRMLRAGLAGFTVTQLDGDPATFATVLAVPRSGKDGVP